MAAAVITPQTDPPLRVPVGQDAWRWSTFHGEKTVVAAVRTLTSALRMLEILPPLLREDSRVTVVFAYDPTSAFNGGVLDALNQAECRTMPWAQLADIEPDLIVSASENLELPDGTCPVLVLPHGVGFQKRVPDSRSVRTRLSGVVPDAWLRSGRAWLAVSHPEQEEQLRAAHPETTGRTLVVGDPVFDELAASLPEAAAHRQRLGVDSGQRLVVVSSTWGDTSSLGRNPDLPAQLLAELPYDEYRLAAIAHPNVWSAHGAWHVRSLQAAALEAGLLLAPPAHLWRSLLVAADLVVGDHGSVTLYGAALGKPTLLAAFGDDAVTGTAADDVRRSAPPLAPRGQRHRQIATELDNARRGGVQGPANALADRAFAAHGQANARLRTALYDLIGLPEPAHRTPRTILPLPAETPPPPVTAWTVRTMVDVCCGRTVLTVRRQPAAVARHMSDETGRTPQESGRTGEEFDHQNERPDSFLHLACDETERDVRLSESASVLVRRQPAATTVEALAWLRDTLRRLPGSRLAAVPVGSGGFLVRLRDGRVVAASMTGPPADAGLPAAVVYACLRARLPLDDVFVTLRVDGAREQDVALRLRPGGPGRA